MSTLVLEEKNEKVKEKIRRTFKEQAISLLRSSGRSAADIERELGITPVMISIWNRKKPNRKVR